MQELIFRGISRDISLPRLLLEQLLSDRTYGLQHALLLRPVRAGLVFLVRVP